MPGTGRVRAGNVRVGRARADSAQVGRDRPCPSRPRYAASAEGVEAGPQVGDALAQLVDGAVQGRVAGLVRQIPHPP
ncbi:hypothetical protein Mro03_15960 [Microbispora rosea subsp. rosea]|nr:hypothetical protein Mro03_15960 [Microbispora rosea subsp. rosea]